LSDPDAFANVCKKALEICHFDPDTGDDLRKAKHAKDECESACYDCLMSYYNQMDHQLLDRQSIHKLLISYSSSTVSLSPVSLNRETHLQQLINLSQSDLETKWLKFLEERDLRLPSKAQQLIEACSTRPDFIYDQGSVTAAIYVDGPHHLYPERQKRDIEQTNCLEDLGYLVIRFGLQNDWDQLIDQYAFVFGKES